MRSTPRVVRALLAAACVVVIAGCAVVRDRPGGDAPIPGTEERDQIAEDSRLSDEALTALVHDTEPGCSAAVAVEGSVIWAGAAGLADLKAKTPLTTETRFDIASVSKQFTATAILMLQREGLLSVSDPVGKYVKGLPSWGATVTLDQLIHHTSRISDFWTELDDAGVSFLGPADQQTTLQAITRLTELEPGKGYLYTNANYVLLAEVVRRVSGETLPHFLAERVFTPLGLEMAVAPASNEDGIATPYADDLNVQLSGWTAYGHTGIITTASELARWGDQYRTGDIVQEDFATGAVDEGADELYAAGIDIEVDGDLNHTGHWGGYVSEFTVSEDRETTVAVLCNWHLADRFGLADALWAIWDPPGSD